VTTAHIRDESQQDRLLPGTSPHRMTFIFGQRTPGWDPGLVQHLFRTEPVVRETLAECSRAISEQLGWSLIDELNRSPKDLLENFSQEHGQPILTAVQIAQVNLWRAHGLRPRSVAGLCGGEVAAAYAAGGLTLGGAMTVACAISELVRTGLSTVDGALLAVDVSEEQFDSLVAAKPNRVYPIEEWSVGTTVLGGDRSTVEALAVTLEQQSIHFRMLPMLLPFHTPLLDRLESDFLNRLRGFEGCPPTIPFYSLTTGSRMPSPKFDGKHWWSVLREPVSKVKFARALLEDGYDEWLYIGLAPGAPARVQEIPDSLGRGVAVYPSLTRLSQGSPRSFGRKTRLFAFVGRLLNARTTRRPWQV
jgi:acyl transferase domain-containing protein